MLHLPIERLAELVDGDPTPSEREHLTVCVMCTRELDAYVSLVRLAADERRRIAPPLTSWESLGSRLRADGLISTDGQPVRRRSRGRAVLEFCRRAAAVIVFVGGGAILGRMSAGMNVADAVAFRAPAGAGAYETFEEGDPRFASDAGTGALTDAFGSPEAAFEALEQAQRQYALAATFLATHDTSTSALATDQYRTRLAALDRAAETMHRAMREAPADPYINQYYLATLSAREQTLRRLGTALPVGNRLGRF